jgi:hypothetical protein
VSEAGEKIPVAVTGMCLVAMGALYVTSKEYAGLLVMGICLLATYAVRWRLPASPLLAWAIRVVVFGAVLMTANPERRTDVGSMVFDPSYTNLFGFLCTAELVIRAWVKRRGGVAKGEMVLLSGLILTAATNANERVAVQWVRMLAPVYVVFLGLTLRAFRKRPRSWAVGWAAALLGVVGIGATSSWAVATLEGQITRWSMQFLSGKNRETSSIGLGRTATLGRSFNPYPSARRVLRMEGWPGEQHLRAMSFDQYNGGIWGPAVDQRDFATVPAEKMLGRVGREVGMTEYASAYGMLCVPLETAGMRVVGDGVEMQQDDAGDVRVPTEQMSDPMRYWFVPGKEGYQGVVAKALTAEERKWLLLVPREMAEKLGEISGQFKEGTTEEKLARIVIYLQRMHHYSLTVDPGDGDPIEAFLLKKLDGHCQYFAASVVILARMSGIPARFAAGYYAHEKESGDVTVVRERDAHAWAECWVEGKGWVTVDATPAGGRPDALFTETPAWRRWWEKGQDLVAAARAWLGERTLMQGAIMIAGLAAIPVFLRVWRGRKDRKRRVASVAYAPVSKEVAEVAKRFERVMKKRGLVCPADRTWRECFAEDERCGPFVREYNALRFGGEGSVQGLRGMVEKLEMEWKR